jgi:hypothetical protein
MTNSNRGLLIGLLLAALPALSPASVIFTNFGPALGYDTLQGNPVGNDFGGDNAAEGDSFTPGSTAKFGSALLALNCAAGCPVASSFAISLDADNADAPGAVIESFLFPATTLGTQGTNNAPIMVTSILKPTLTAGARYWITVSSSTNFAISWSLNTTGDASDQAVSSDGGASWFAPSGMTPSALEVDSTTTSSVPEPTTFLLGGAMTLGLLRRKTAAGG